MATSHDDVELLDPRRCKPFRAARGSRYGYHVTGAGALATIVQAGLLPRASSDSTRGFPAWSTFFVSSPFIVRHWGGDEAVLLRFPWPADARWWTTEGERRRILAVLRRYGSLPIELFGASFPVESDPDVEAEHITRQCIPPDKISIFTRRLPDSLAFYGREDQALRYNALFDRVSDWAPITRRTRRGLLAPF